MCSSLFPTSIPSPLTLRFLPFSFSVFIIESSLCCFNSLGSEPFLVCGQPPRSYTIEESRENSLSPQFKNVSGLWTLRKCSQNQYLEIFYCLNPADFTNWCFCEVFMYECMYFASFFYVFEQNIDKWAYKQWKFVWILFFVNVEESPQWVIRLSYGIKLWSKYT